MTGLLHILFDPEAASRRFLVSRGWIAPFTVLAIGHLALLLISQASTGNAAIAHLPPSATPAEREAVRSMLTADLAPRVLMLPVRLLTGWFAFSMLLSWLVASARPERSVSVQRLFVLEVHAEVVLLLGAFASALIPALGVRSVDLARMAPVWSLAHYWPGVSMPVFFLLRAANIFTLWYAVILTAGIHVLSNLPYRTSVSIAAGACTIGALFDAGILSLLIEQLHLGV
jgi:hypothetical protein